MNEKIEETQLLDIFKENRIHAQILKLFMTQYPDFKYEHVFKLKKTEEPFLENYKVFISVGYAIRDYKQVLNDLSAMCKSINLYIDENNFAGNLKAQETLTQCYILLNCIANLTKLRGIKNTKLNILINTNWRVKKMLDSHGIDTKIKSIPNNYNFNYEKAYTFAMMNNQLI